MVISLILFLALFIVSYWRRMHQRLAEQKFKYNLFALRDRLRKLAIEQKISPDDWLFQYLDRSFSKTIADSYYMTIFFVITRAIKRSEDERYVQFIKTYERSMESNEEMKAVASDYSNAVKQYMEEQTYIGYTLFIQPVFTVLFGAVIAQIKLSRYINATLYQPGNGYSRISSNHFHLGA